jgi:hypothetical protein
MSTSSQDRPDLGGTTKELHVSEIVGGVTEHRAINPDDLVDERK